MRRIHRLPQRFIRWTDFAVSLALITSSIQSPAIARGKSRIRLALSQRPSTSQRQRQAAPRDDSRKVDPIPSERGAPATNLPNLDELRSRKPEKPEAPPPVPSTIRSKRKRLMNGN